MMNNVIHIPEELRRDIVSKVVAERLLDLWDSLAEDCQIDPDSWGSDYVDDELRQIDAVAGPDDETEEEHDKRQTDIALLAFEIGLDCFKEMEKRLMIREQRLGIVESIRNSVHGICLKISADTGKARGDFEAENWFQSTLAKIFQKQARCCNDWRSFDLH